MKRQALLMVTGCDLKRFEGYHFRKQLPFTPAPSPIDGRTDPANRRADYSMQDALSLRLMLDLVEAGGISIDAAKYAAGNALRHLRRASQVAAPGADIWLVYAQDRETTVSSEETIIPRHVKACVLDKLPELIGELQHPELQFVTMVNASRASRYVYEQALAEGILAADMQPIDDIWQVDFAHSEGE